MFVHAGNQANTLGYITKINLFDTAPVCVRGVYAYKLDEILQCNMIAGRLWLPDVILSLAQIKNIAIAVYQPVTFLVIV